MRITREADYAIRVMYSLAQADGKLSARQISEQTDVTPRFALKILRKLIKSEFVQSFKGVTGGYVLKLPASEISLGQIIESIDGPIAINYCLKDEFACVQHATENGCCFQNVFREINTILKDKLYSVKLNQFIPEQKHPANKA